MDRHNYVRVGKFKNSNCPYALVNGIVFPSIFDAESYCTREGLDVNTSIRSDDPEVLAECQQIARATLPMLREIQNHFRRSWDGVRTEVSEKAAARDAAKEKHELGWRVHQDWVLEAVGKSTGFYDCMVLIGPYIETLEKVLRLKATPKA